MNNRSPGETDSSEDEFVGEIFYGMVAEGRGRGRGRGRGIARGLVARGRAAGLVAPPSSPLGFQPIHQLQLAPALPQPPPPPSPINFQPMNQGAGHIVNPANPNYETQATFQEFAPDVVMTLPDTIQEGHEGEGEEGDEGEN